MFPALRPILNKGGAGRYISREESVTRLLPVAQRHLDLLHRYDGVLAAMPIGPGRERIDAMMPYLRTEIAKMSETILSLGGTPPTGVDRDPAGPTAGDNKSLLQSLLDAEKDFGGALRHEADEVHHQERTRAILGHNADASTSRIDLLRDVVANHSS
ncbi:hypothetical protein [Rubrivirga sp.]|uniref:hypothetical protein n=1 Tax=Rubrivirga sp. TaxID=1885344 RepID=UPI003C780DA0